MIQDLGEVIFFLSNYFFGIIYMVMCFEFVLIIVFIINLGNGEFRILFQGVRKYGFWFIKIIIKGKKKLKNVL